MRAVFLVAVALATLSLGGGLVPISIAFAQLPATDAAAEAPNSSVDAGQPGETVVDLSPDAQANSPSSSPAPVQTAVVAAPPGAAPASSPPPPRPLQTAPADGYVHDRFYAGASTGLGHLVAWGNGPSGPASISGFAMNFDSSIGGSPVRGLAIAFVTGGATLIASTFKGGPAVTATSMVGNVQGMPMPITGNARASSFLLGVRADWFPVASGPWHVGADIDFGGVSVTDDAGKTITGFSVAGSILGGYQWWIGPGWSIGIAAVVSAAPSLKMVDSHNSDTGYGLAPVFVGIESPILYY